MSLLSKSDRKVMEEIVAEDFRNSGLMRRGEWFLTIPFVPNSGFNTTKTHLSLSGSSLSYIMDMLTDVQHAYDAVNVEKSMELDATFARTLDRLEREGTHNLDDVGYSTVYNVFSENQIEAILGRNPNYGMIEALFRAPKVEHNAEDPRQIVTTLNLDAWKSTLAEFGLLAKHQHILYLIENGFPLGVNWDLTQTVLPRHHGSAMRHPEIIEEYIAKEVRAGRYSRAYRPEELERLIGPFYCSPMGTVDKPDKPGKKRVIHDDTYPGEKSQKALNTHCVYASDSYSWLPFDEMAKRVKETPIGTHACAFDGEAAYRMCATRLEDQRFTCIEWKGEVRVDRAPHFGGKNAGVPHGQVADVLHEIIRAKWPTAITGKWQDDHLIIRIPSASFFRIRPAFELSDIIQLTDKLGYRTNRDKDQEFTEIITYLGFQWNFRDRTVALTEKKKVLYVESLDEVLARQPHVMSLEDLVELNGRLTHTCQVFPQGRGRLRSFIKEISRRGGYGNPSSKSKENRIEELEDTVVNDMKWWRNTLQANIPMQLKDKPDLSDNWVIYTDACSDWGIGVVINNQWDRWKLADNWDLDGERHIGWAEGIAVEVAVHVLFSQFRIPRGTHIRIWCDNKGFVDSWQRGASRNWDQNTIITRVLEEVLNQECYVTLEYTPGKDNPADAPSRGKEQPGMRRVAWGHRVVPDHLRGVLTPGL
ncbi:hypothetical protein FRC15_010127 [Serendipita sp. 397]|nr:hypothetical protein FRC15_010127 [Serendipita sp. 397]